MIPWTPTLNPPLIESLETNEFIKNKELIEQLEDESDWEIYGILSGELSIGEKLFTQIGNENVVTCQFIEEIPRCHAIFK